MKRKQWIRTQRSAHGCQCRQPSCLLSALALICFDMSLYGTVPVERFRFYICLLNNPLLFGADRFNFIWAIAAQLCNGNCHAAVLGAYLLPCNNSDLTLFEWLCDGNGDNVNLPKIPVDTGKFGRCMFRRNRQRLHSMHFRVALLDKVFLHWVMAMIMCCFSRLTPRTVETCSVQI